GGLLSANQIGNLKAHLDASQIGIFKAHFDAYNSLNSLGTIKSNVDPAVTLR
ncbi:hypothetical protein TorRG33x02_271650, partial [Trema orientale]